MLNGDGYLRGEILVYGIGYSFDTHEILYEIWVNKTTGIQINNLKSASGLKEITDTKEINIFIPDISTEYSKAKDSTD